MSYMRLLKVLYIAERELLRDYEVPLTGSRVIAMKHGPVLEDVFSLIRHQHMGTARWAEVFEQQGFDLVLISDPDVGRLSPFITRKLDDVATRHAQDDQWQLVEATHEFSEWQKNNPGTSSKPIPLEDILAAVGKLESYDSIVRSAIECSQACDFFSESES